jgi:hypothetical protein
MTRFERTKLRLLHWRYVVTLSLTAVLLGRNPRPVVRHFNEQLAQNLKDLAHQLAYTARSTA